MDQMTPHNEVPKQADVAEGVVVEFWEGHQIVKKLGEKTVGQQKFIICQCDDGCTYDVPASELSLEQ